MTGHSLTAPRRALTILLVAAVTALLLAACGGDGDSPTGGGRGRLTDPSGVPTATLAPEEEQTVVQVGEGSVIQSTINPRNPGGTATQRYTIELGDTCAAIAQNHGITLDALQEANPEADCSFLIAGTDLNIPTAPEPTPTSEAGGDASTTPTTGSSDDDQDNVSAYTIQLGDTCGAIAQNHGISTDDLIDANPGIDCSFLIAGTDLNIPGN